MDIRLSVRVVPGGGFRIDAEKFGEIEAEPAGDTALRTAEIAGKQAVRTEIDTQDPRRFPAALGADGARCFEKGTVHPGAGQVGQVKIPDGIQSQNEISPAGLTT